MDEDDSDMLPQATYWGPRLGTWDRLPEGGFRRRRDEGERPGITYWHIAVAFLCALIVVLTVAGAMAFWASFTHGTITLLVTYPPAAPPHLMPTPTPSALPTVAPR